MSTPLLLIQSHQGTHSSSINFTLDLSLTCTDKPRLKWKRDYMVCSEEMCDDSCSQHLSWKGKGVFLISAEENKVRSSYLMCVCVCYEDCRQCCCCLNKFDQLKKKKKKIIWLNTDSLILSSQICYVINTNSKYVKSWM